MIRLSALLLCTLATPVAADFDADDYPRHETCALCHGLFGVSHLSKFPHLGGQKPAYLTAQIQAFVDGHRTNDGGQMMAIVTELQPGDIPAVVEWFSQQDPPPPSAPPASDTGQQRVTEAGCLTCHGDAVENSDHIPHLSAQHAGYLSKQMNDFRTGARSHSDAAELHRQLLGQIEQDIEEMAAYLASLERTK